MAAMNTRQTQGTEELKSLLRTTDENIKSGIYSENHHSFSIDSPFIFWGFSGMFATIVILAVALYFTKQSDYDRIDNDLKYRYIKMKGEASSKRIENLENIFELNRDNNKIRQMRKNVKPTNKLFKSEPPLPNKPVSKNRRQRNRKTRQSPSKANPFNRTNLKSEHMASVYSFFCSNKMTIIVINSYFLNLSASIRHSLSDTFAVSIVTNNFKFSTLCQL